MKVGVLVPNLTGHHVLSIKEISMWGMSGELHR